MATKHQSECYRVFDGRRYTNYADLVMSDAENQRTYEDAREKYKYVRRIKHQDGYYQLFVSN